MIKEKEIKIKITSRNKSFYKKYNTEINKIISVNINDLNKNSKNKITAICDICNAENIISIQNYWKNYNKYKIYTCKKCSHIKNKQTNLEKYGVEHPMQNKEIQKKVKQTNLEKYDVENIFQNEKIKEKSRNTSLEKYGAEYHLQNKKQLEKQEKTNLEKYGVKRPAQNIEISNKISKTTFSLYHKYSNIINKNQIENKKYNNLEIYCDKCDNSFIINEKTFYSRLLNNDEICIICNPLHKSISKLENDLLIYIKSIYDKTIIQSERTILDGKEIDIYLPDIKLGFEFNGDYWHSLKTPGYHFSKSRNALKKDIRLYHIWENVWINENKKIKVFIKNKIIDNEKTY